MRKLSARENRTAKTHLAYYNKPGQQRGAIVVGRGLNKVQAILDAWAQGFRVYGQGDVLTLH